MNQAEHWIALLHRLDCVHDGVVSGPPGYNLELNFVDSLSDYSYPSGLKGGESVTLEIEGVFIKVTAGPVRTFIGMDQLLSVSLTAATPQ